MYAIRSYYADPAGARVRILNIGPPYRDGIELAGGAYHLEISAPGYQTDSRWVDVGSGEDKQVAIQLLPASTVSSPPATPPVASPPPPAVNRAGNRYISLLRSKSLRSKTDAGKLIVRNSVTDTATLDVVEA